jgi:ABC-type transport system involved in multi-copper enzyme maturation permease subunit
MPLPESPRRSSPRPSFLRSALQICDLSFGQMLWSRRSIFLAIVVGGPVVLALMIRLIGATLPAGQLIVNRNTVSGPAMFGVMIWLLYIRFIVPILGVFYGTALIADEVEDKTITYLFTRPIHRGAVLAGKYLSYLVCTTMLILPSVVLVYFLIVPLGGGSIGRGFPSLLTDLGMLALGLAAYGAVFALAGARLQRPLVIGLVFVLGWEPGVLVFPGYLKRVTVAYYLQGLVPHALPEDSSLGALLQAFREVPSTFASVVWLGIITAGTLALAVRTVAKREYVLEQ